MKATNDVTFKNIFSDETIVKDFINSVFKRDLVQEILKIECESSVIKYRRSERGCIADVYCKLDDGCEVIIEMQMHPVDAFHLRVTYECSSRFVKQLESGDDYSKLRPVYVIAVCCFNLFPERSWYSHYQYLNRTVLEENVGKLLTSNMLQCDFPVYESVILQLPKFADGHLDGNKPDIDFWMTFFKRKFSAGERKVIRSKKPSIESAIKKLETMQLSEEDWKEYERCEKISRLMKTEERREEELKRREEEAKRREEEGKRREEEGKRREEEAKRREEEGKRLVNEMKRVLQEGGDTTMILSKLPKFE